MSKERARGVVPEKRYRSYAPISRKRLGILGCYVPLVVERMNGSLTALASEMECQLSTSEKTHVDISMIPEIVKECLKESTSFDSVLTLLNKLKKAYTSDDIYLNFRFLYPMDWKTGQAAYYKSAFEARFTDQLLRFYLSVDIAHKSGILRTTVNVDPGNMVFFDELIDVLLSSLVDAKTDTSVQDVVGEAARALDSYARVVDYVVVCEKPSMDGYQPIAIARKGIVGGLR